MNGLIIGCVREFLDEIAEITRHLLTEWKGQNFNHQKELTDKSFPFAVDLSVNSFEL